MNKDKAPVKVSQTSKASLLSKEIINFDYEVFVTHNELLAFTGKNALQRIIVRVEEDDSYSLWFQLPLADKLAPLYTSKGEIRTWRDFTKLFHYIKGRLRERDHILLTVADGSTKKIN